MKENDQPTDDFGIPIRSMSSDHACHKRYIRLYVRVGLETRL